MFFGRNETAEKLPSDSLEAMLDSLFNKRMGPLEGRASAIVRELHVAKEHFYSACKEFEKLDAEPYTEDLWMPNINSIKSQKSQYAAALREIANSLDLESDGSLNIYSRYALILSNVESMTSNALRTNAKFKQAFYCYSNHLGNFKKASAQIERLTEMLRNEIGRRAAEFEQYSNLKESIMNLKLKGDELAALSGSIAALKSNLKSSDSVGLDRVESETRKKLSEKSLELSDVGREISRLTSSINLLTASLERPSKKLDHLNIRKKSLHAFVADPVDTIKNEAEYKDFIELVQELKKNVDSGAIDTKNRQDLQNSIATLLNSDIYLMISSLKTTERKKADITAEQRELDRVLDGIISVREGTTSSLHQIERMESDYANISRSRESLKSDIEKGFSANYGKRISIML